VYRFCDIGLLLGAWMNHLFFHEAQYFSHLHKDTVFNAAMANISFPVALTLSLLVVIAASGKSAQFPFSFWLPRAMEGPTPSSAIFYGALSVHLGVFLLLRTMPIWSYYFVTQALVFVIGLLSVFFASLAGQVQSNIKAQIAYSSIAQVGLMFIELALGLETLVLIHFLGNAFLRCYQLLVSPSIVAHLLRVEGAADTDYRIEEPPLFGFLKVPAEWRETLYVLAIQEGNLDRHVRDVLWAPLKRLGYRINQFNQPWIRLALVVAIVGLVFMQAESTPASGWAFVLTSLLMVIVSASAFSDKHDVLRAWNAAGMSALLAGLTIWFINAAAFSDVLLFYAGVVPAWLLGSYSIMQLTKGHAVAFFNYHGGADKQPLHALLLFIGFLGLSGFPITSAFIGEDLLLHHASHDHIWVAAVITFAFVINGITLARVFVTLCMGSGIWRPLVETNP
jgi:NADH-quinone oxidoreductase subunit L